MTAAPHFDLVSSPISRTAASLVGAWPAPALLVAPDGRVLAHGGEWPPPGPPARLSDAVGSAAAARLLSSDVPTRVEVGDLEARGRTLEDGSRIVALTGAGPDSLLRMHLHHAERLASIGELLSSVAHELTNPLTSVLGYAELLLGDAGAPTAELERIRSEATRCRRIVANLLDLARAEALEFEPLSLASVVDKVIEFRSYAAKVRQVDLAAEVAPGLPLVEGDFHRLVQSVLNLVTNAEHSVAERASERRVLVRAHRRGDLAAIEVEDNGPGVPEELRESIFRPFFTTKPRGKGTGLGLSLVRATVEAHGGTVYVEPANRGGGEGGGARFVLCLPFMSATEAAGAADDLAR